jgi:hypothetical protein
MSFIGSCSFGEAQKTIVTLASKCLSALGDLAERVRKLRRQG